VHLSSIQPFRVPCQTRLSWSTRNPVFPNTKCISRTSPQIIAPLRNQSPSAVWHRHSEVTIRQLRPRYHTIQVEGSACAYPSWPSGNSLSAIPNQAHRAHSSATLDLFPDDILDDESGFNAAPLLHEAPAPPRPGAFGPSLPALLPLYASEKTKEEEETQQRSAKQRRPSKPMTPISESPEGARVKFEVEMRCVGFSIFKRYVDHICNV